MQVRSPVALALALSFLAAAAGLGLLVHDAEVGGPTAARLGPGDEVRIRGDVHDLGRPPIPVSGSFAWFDSPHWSGPILVLGDELPEAGTWVIEGTVDALLPWIDDTSMMVLHAFDIDAPILFS